MECATSHIPREILDNAKEGTCNIASFQLVTEDKTRVVGIMRKSVRFHVDVTTEHSLARDICAFFQLIH